MVAHLAAGDRAALATIQGPWELGGWLDEDPGASPDLVLEADPLAYVLRAAGRTAEDPWRAAGDARLAADVAASLSSAS